MLFDPSSASTVSESSTAAPCKKKTPYKRYLCTRLTINNQHTPIGSPSPTATPLRSAATVDPRSAVRRSKSLATVANAVARKRASRIGTGIHDETDSLPWEEGETRPLAVVFKKELTDLLIRLDAKSSDWRNAAEFLWFKLTTKGSEPRVCRWQGGNDGTL